MSKIAFCVRGGMDGILVTNAELSKFATKLKHKYIDQVIPLPNTTFAEQNKAIKECGELCGEHPLYWEVKTSGSHGWCCSKCGTVTQWG